MDSEALPHKKLSTKEASLIYGVSVRRIQQLIKQYKEGGEMPVLKKERGPRTYLTAEHKEIIEEWRETRVEANCTGTGIGVMRIRSMLLCGWMRHHARFLAMVNLKKQQLRIVFKH